MSKQEVRKLLELIISLYPSFKLSTDTANIWVECLSDIGFERGRSNLINHVKQNRFPPTIADIRGITAKGSLKNNFCDVVGKEYELYQPIN